MPLGGIGFDPQPRPLLGTVAAPSSENPLTPAVVTLVHGIRGVERHRGRGLLSPGEPYPSPAPFCAENGLLLTGTLRHAGKMQQGVRLMPGAAKRECREGCSCPLCLHLLGVSG